LAIAVTLVLDKAGEDRQQGHDRLAVVVKGRTMDTRQTVRVFSAAELAHASDDTVINWTPYGRTEAFSARAADRSRYWQEYLHDRDPDLDEWLDQG
jgi:hypothetical protein